MKKKLIQAYLNGNFGDDLFLALLAERFPNHQFIVLDYECPNSSFFRKYDNLCFLRVNFIKRIVNLVSVRFLKRFLFLDRLFPKYDMYILLGGSMFIENHGWEKRLEQISTLQKSSTNSCVLGANFGPYSSAFFLKRNKLCLKSFSSVAFRDSYSACLFADLPNVFWGNDIAFSLKKEKYSLSDNHVVISVCNFKTSNDEVKRIYCCKIAECIEFLVSNKKKVFLVGLCKNEGDDCVINEVKEKTRCQFNIYLYDGNLDETISLFASAECIVATRFHSMIMGFIFEKKVIPIMYSKKMENVLNDMNFIGYSCSVENIRDFDVEKAFFEQCYYDVKVYLKQKNIFNYLDRMFDPYV